MKDGIIIQARTGSTRLHNKILLPFYGEQRIIDILIANIKQACPDKCIVLATTNRPQDDVLAETARQAGILSFRGDEDNVLDRLSVLPKFSVSTALSVFVRIIRSFVPKLSIPSLPNTISVRQIISPMALPMGVLPSNPIWAYIPS